ncbi:MAG: hypothetical protein AABN95_10785 [Acidobacteriota bacterium]
MDVSNGPRQAVASVGILTSSRNDQSALIDELDDIAQAPALVGDHLLIRRNSGFIRADAEIRRQEAGGRRQKDKAEVIRANP